MTLHALAQWSVQLKEALSSSTRHLQEVITRASNLAVEEHRATDYMKS
jgi:hypothetical protein